MITPEKARELVIEAQRTKKKEFLDFCFKEIRNNCDKGYVYFSLGKSQSLYMLNCAKKELTKIGFRVYINRYGELIIDLRPKKKYLKRAKAKIRKFINWGVDYVMYKKDKVIIKKGK